MRLYAQKLVLTVAMMLLSTNYGNLSAGQDQISEPYKILFIGSSYFNYNNLTGIFESLVDSSGLEAHIEKQISNGLYLEDHSNSSATELKISTEKWDYVILQGVGRLTAYPTYYSDHPVYRALRLLKEKISKNCESTKVVFCLPWAYEDGMTWLEGWTDTYEDMQLKIYENTLKYSDDLDFLVAPVGWAWNTVLREKNYPLHYLHRSDWNHPSLKGSYLMACVIYSTIFKMSSNDIDYSSGLSKEETNYFQTVASSTVLDSLELWNIIATNISAEEYSIPEKFHLHQNYPNPFNPSTTISYSVAQGGLIQLKVYDMLGREVANLIDEVQASGNYKIEFNASSLTSGVYYYKLQSSIFTETKKLILLK